MLISICVDMMDARKCILKKPIERDMRRHVHTRKKNFPQKKSVYFIVRRAGVANHLRQNLIVTDTKQHVADQKGR